MFQFRVNFAYQNCINYPIIIKQHKEFMNILNYLQYPANIPISTPQSFTFLHILILCFSSYSGNSGSVFVFILYWYLEYWCWSCSHPTYPCIFFSAHDSFSGSHFGCHLEYVENFKKMPMLG